MTVIPSSIVFFYLLLVGFSLIHQGSGFSTTARCGDGDHGIHHRQWRHVKRTSSSRILQHSQGVDTAITSLTMASNSHQDCQLDTDRRNSIKAMVATPLALLTAPKSCQASATPSSSTSSTTTTTGEEPSGLVSPEKVASLLRVVPTFTIVDEKGVPFMVVGEDAKVTAYFFTQYDEAKRILNSAKVSADKAIQQAKRDPEQKDLKEIQTMKNPWLQARVSTVPLDFAATLVTQSTIAGRSMGGNYFQVAPSERDVEDALTLTQKDDLTEGKVPLFYLEDFELDNGDKPLYFQKAQLEQAYRKQVSNNNNKSTETTMPPIQVTELFSVVLEMVRPGGTDTDLQKLVFVPPVDSDKKRQLCQKQQKGESPFVVGRRNIVL